MKKYYLTGAIVVADVFQNLIKSDCFENIDLKIKFRLTDEAEDLNRYYRDIPPDEMNENWNKLKAKLVIEEPLYKNTIDINAYESFFKEVAAMPSQEFIKLHSKACYDRSREFARYSLELAKKESSDVVYMSYGLLILMESWNILRRPILVLLFLLLGTSRALV